MSHLEHGVVASAAPEHAEAEEEGAEVAPDEAEVLAGEGDPQVGVLGEPRGDEGDEVAALELAGQQARVRPGGGALGLGLATCSCSAASRPPPPPRPPS